jgi:Holliday junction DNA helicase RuvA
MKQRQGPYMISHITGTITHNTDKQVSIDTGVFGFCIQVPNGLHYPPNKVATLLVHMHWNQDQGPSLYGFSNQLEKTVFLLLISCSGIGPKIGLAVLADLGPERFLETVQTVNHTALSKVSGIGTKKAEQIIVQLKGKVADVIKSGVNLGSAHHLTEWQTVVQALESLNYSRTEITHAMSYVQQQAADDTRQRSFDQLLRQALSYLSKQA